MGLLNKKFECVGIKLWKWRNFQIELWICPARIHIPVHIHNDVNGRFIHLFGRASIHKNGKTKILPFFTGFKSYLIPAKVKHGALTITKFIFLNIEEWNTTPTSTAIDCEII